jgi:hypothetical protein
VVYTSLEFSFFIIGNSIIYLTELMWELNEITHSKSIAKCWPTQSLIQYVYVYTAHNRSLVRERIKTWEPTNKLVGFWIIASFLMVKELEVLLDESFELHGISKVKKKKSPFSIEGFVQLGLFTCKCWKEKAIQLFTRWKRIPRVKLLVTDCKLVAF